jgi:hypothetical protein
MKQPDWADRSWLLQNQKIAADSGVKTLTAVILALTAITLWVF